MSTTLAATASLADAAALFGRVALEHVEIVDAEGRVEGVLIEEDLRLGLAGKSRPHHPVTTLMRQSTAARPTSTRAPRPVRRALLMAGGLGSRLRPLTDSTPKPLLPIDGEPLLHRLLGQLANAGIEQVWISVHYLADRVEASVGDGSRFGLEVEYIRETTPLGTAGALGLLPRADDGTAIAMMNGDVFHDANLTAMFGWHDRNGNQVTVATHLYEVEVPFGLAHFERQKLERLEEKPTLRLPVNAGIYVFEESRLEDVPHGQPWDMVDWLNDLAQQGVVGQFPLVERWHDIGSLEEYERLK